MKKFLIAAVAGFALLGGTVGASSLPPGDDPESTADPQTGAGPSGDQTAVPVCAVGEAFNFDSETCAPITAYSPGLVQIPTDGSQCTIADGVDYEIYVTSTDKIFEYFACIVPDLEAWIDTVYAGMAHPNAYYYVPSGVSGSVNNNGKTCAWTAEEAIYFYCPADGSVYLGQDFTWHMFSELGDLVPAFALAHELGHRFQHVLQFPDPSAYYHIIPTENQADCIAGVYVDNLADRALLDFADGNDIADIAQGMIFLGSEPGPERDHGTIDQRMRAFYAGYNGNVGLYACNYLVTNVVLAPQ